MKNGDMPAMAQPVAIEYDENAPLSSFLKMTNHANRLQKQLDELKASMPKIKADSVISALDSCAWHHGKEFIKIDELIEYANQLEGKE